MLPGLLFQGLGVCVRAGGLGLDFEPSSTSPAAFGRAPSVSVFLCPRGSSTSAAGPAAGGWDSAVLPSAPSPCCCQPPHIRCAHRTGPHPVVGGWRRRPPHPEGLLHSESGPHRRRPACTCWGETVFGCKVFKYFKRNLIGLLRPRQYHLCLCVYVQMYTSVFINSCL